MMAIDAYHVIYMIRITRQFSFNKIQTHSNTLEEIFFSHIVYLHLISLYSHGLPHLFIVFTFCFSTKCNQSYIYIYIQDLSIRANIISVQHSIVLPTVGNIHKSHHISPGMTSLVR